MVFQIENMLLAPPIQIFLAPLLHLPASKTRWLMTFSNFRPRSSMSNIPTENFRGVDGTLGTKMGLLPLILRTRACAHIETLKTSGHCDIRSGPFMNYWPINRETGRDCSALPCFEKPNGGIFNHVQIHLARNKTHDICPRRRPVNIKTSCEKELSCAPFSSFVDILSRNENCTYFFVTGELAET